MIITLSCNRVITDGHIDIDGGIFSVFDETVRRVRTQSIIPAIDNTSCKCRRTARCNTDCSHAIHTIVAGGKVSYHQLNKRI